MREGLKMFRWVRAGEDQETAKFCLDGSLLWRAMSLRRVSRGKRSSRLGHKTRLKVVDHSEELRRKRQNQNLVGAERTKLRRWEIREMLMSNRTL